MKFLKFLAISYLATCVIAQVVPPITLPFYSGSNLQYVCTASPVQPSPTSFTVASGLLTNIVVSGGTATVTFSSTSYLWVGAQIVVSGSTTAALNGNYTVTGVSGSTATFTTASGNATYNNSTLYLSTVSPLLNQPVWLIMIFAYNGSGNLISVRQAGSSLTPQRLQCSQAANY